MDVPQGETCDNTGRVKIIALNNDMDYKRKLPINPALIAL
jgi:hypothetical protein